ncbi:hypothetical protein BN3661_01839 [Eubacteriaceae bacterium CHKCI005]|nr:hypothetical protein BN3661_01839 [Eubacteriaceae bacterium CHKCI005]
MTMGRHKSNVIFFDVTIAFRNHIGNIIPFADILSIIGDADGLCAVANLEGGFTVIVDGECQEIQGIVVALRQIDGLPLGFERIILTVFFAAQDKVYTGSCDRSRKQFTGECILIDG